MVICLLLSLWVHKNYSILVVFAIPFIHSYSLFIYLHHPQQNLSSPPTPHSKLPSLPPLDKRHQHGHQPRPQHQTDKVKGEHKVPRVPCQLQGDARFGQSTQRASPRSYFPRIRSTFSPAPQARLYSRYEKSQSARQRILDKERMELTDMRILTYFFHYFCSSSSSKKNSSRSHRVVAR